MLLFEVGGLVAVGISHLLLGLGVISRDRTRLSNVFFLLISLSMAFWSLGIAAFLFTPDLAHAAVYANIYYAAALGMAVFLGLFSIYWTASRPPKRNAIILGGTFALYCLIILIFPRFILQNVFFNGAEKTVSFNVIGQIIYSVLFVVIFFSGVIKLARALSAQTQIRRAQTKYIILGTISASAVGLTFNLVMPWFGHYSQIWVGPLFSVLFTGFVVYAINRHKLFDFRRAIARAVGYLVTLGFLALIYIAVLFILTDTIFADQPVSLGQRLFFIMFALFSAVSFHTLRRFFDRRTNRYFYRDAYDPEAFLDRLNNELVSNIELEVLLRRTCAIIQDTLKSEVCIVALKDQANAPIRAFSANNEPLKADDLEVWYAGLNYSANRLIVTDNIDDSNPELRAALSDDNIAILAPINVSSHKNALAFLALGPKKSGNMYGKEDLRIIEIISDELVIAIQNALRFEEIQGFAATLQAKVKEATTELKAANIKLKELDASKDEFISMASHQLRTPLTSVKGYLSMVLEGDAGKLTAMQRKLLTQSFVSSQRMVYLIADLLNVSRLKTGKFVLEAAPTNLADVVEGEISQLTETAAGRGLELIYMKPATFPSLMLDETKIRQVIMNFVDNAIYYTPTGGHIEVKLIETDQSVELTVIDDGLGVPKFEQPHLFTKFYRAGNARKARPDGTGLGLFMARKVIVAQGGSIIFSSTEGKGSTFGFSFAKAKLL